MNPPRRRIGQPEPTDPRRTPEGQHWAKFGKWVESTRIRRGLRKTHAARAADMSFSSWTALEQGGRMLDGKWKLPNPIPLTMFKAARALGLPVNEVLRRAGMEPLAED